MTAAQGGETTPERPDVPPFLAPDFDVIPPALKEHPYWAIWKAEPRANGKISKAPRDPRTGRNISVNNPAEWATYEECLAAVQQGKADGFGILLDGTTDLIGIDLDSVKTATADNPQIAEFIKDARDIGCYLERSPSSTGVRVFVRGKMPKDGYRKGYVEIYAGKRFMTVTGRKIGDGKIKHDQAVVDKCVALAGGGGNDTHKVDKPLAKEDSKVALLDRNRAIGSIAAEVAQRKPELWAGDWQRAVDPEWSVGETEYPSQSEADLALVGDIVRIGLKQGIPESEISAIADEVFRSSGLVREKWIERPDYRERTIHRAIQSALAVGNPTQGACAATQQAPSEKALREVDLTDIAKAELPKPEPVIAPLLFKKYVTLFGSHGGSGKSIQSLVWAMHVALGMSWGGLAVRQGKVLVVSLEDGADLIRYRISKILSAYNCQSEVVMLLKNMVILDGTNSGAMATENYQNGQRLLVMTGAWPELQQRARQFEPDLIVIDNASDASDFDENSRRLVRPFLHALMQLAGESDAAILLLAHIDKNAARNGANGNAYSGSTAWHNGPRSRLTLINNELHQEKLNLGRGLETPIPIFWDGPVPKPDPGGLHRAAERSTQQASDDTAVLSAITALVRQGETVHAAPSGPKHGTTWGTLHAQPGLPPDLREDTSEARRRVREAVQRLCTAGHILREKYKDTNRKDRERLVLPPSPDGSS